MRFAPVYWNDAEPAGETLDQVLYRLRRLDAEDGLIFDRVTLDDLMEMADGGPILLDALVTTRVLLDRKMTAIERVMNAASRTLDVTATQVSDPFKRQGVINVAVIFELSDGQTITVVFHNPDAKNVKALKPGDDLISWKWMLNKRDVTIVVAPEKGTDLPIRQVARRLMLLAEKNSGAFQRLNQKRAARLENIEGLKTEIQQLETEYSGLLKQIEVAKLEAEERAANPSPVVEPEPVVDPAPEPTIDPEIPDNPYWRAMTATERAKVGASVGWATKTGRPNAKAKAAALHEWPDLAEETRAQLLQSPVLNPDAASVEPEPEPTEETDITPDALARVDAAYRFANATDEFKAWVAESVDSTQGPFATARAMEERAKAHGATIEWGLFNGAALDSVYVEDGDEALPPDPDTLPLFDAASDHWKQQPRDRKTGRWALRRTKRAKQAVSGLIDKALKAARKVAHHARIHRDGPAKPSMPNATGDPLMTALGELTGALDSAAVLDTANDGTEYVGKIRKDGETVGRVDMGDDGKAMVFVGAAGDVRVSIPGKPEIPIHYSDDDAPDMVDWLFAAGEVAPEPENDEHEYLNNLLVLAENRPGVMRHDRIDVYNPDGPHYGVEGFKFGDDISTTKRAIDLQIREGRYTRHLPSKKIDAYPITSSEASLLADLDGPSNGTLKPFHYEGIWWLDAPTVILAMHGRTANLSPAQIETLKVIDRRTAEVFPLNLDQQPSDTDSGLTPDGAENTVKTAKGTQIATGFTVVEADTLIVSHDSQGNPNPDYPAELQPRDRGRETSIAWVRKTANQLDPDSLGKTRRADTGAPIVGPDRVVESGNGRTMAIQEAYRAGKADEYRDWLIEEAESFGLNPDRIRAMKRPVLVRVRTSDIDRRTFAIEANQDDKLAMTATEKARSDADRLDEALLSKLAGDGDLLSAANRDFIRGFLASLGDAEAAQYITTDGQPTAALIARVQAAVFAKAYSDDRLLELTADASKPEIANILNALNAAALEFIQAQAAAKSATDALTSEIANSVEVSLNTQAVQAIIDATNLVRKARAEGQSVDEVVNQRGLFDDIPPATAAMALFIHKNNRSAKRMATAFKAMARYVRKEAERGQTVDLFGDLKPATLEDIIGAANQELEREYGEGQFAIETLDLFGAKPPGPTDPVAQLKDLLLRGEIGAASDLLAGLKKPELQEALLKNGFAIGGNSAPEILSSVQQDLIRAAKLKTDGFGLRELDAQPPAVEPEPETPVDPQKDADRAFLQAVIDGGADFYDATITDRLAPIAERYADDPEIAPLIQQAKTAAKNWFFAEFKRKTEGMAV